MKTVADILKGSSFFTDLSDSELAFIAGCASLVHFPEGKIIANHGDEANTFFLIREGSIALSIEEKVGKPFLYETLGPLDIVGLSWLIPPYRWTASAIAQADVKALSFNGRCIRDKCEKDHSLGYKMMRHLLQLMVEREDALKLHLLDIFGRR